MSRPFLFLLLLLQGVPAPGQGGGAPAGDPRDVLLAARHAVEGDSVARVRGRWEQAVRRAPVDRAAQLGLATLARLTNDYAAADRAYAALVATDPARDDAVGAYARVGRALNYRAQNLVPQTVAAMDTARVALAAARRPELLAPMLEYLATQRPAAARQPAIDSGFAALGPADSVAIGEMHCARAAVDVTSDFARRAAAADTGLAIARRTGLRSNEAACHHSRAIVFLEQGLIESAIERLVIADSLFARAHNSRCVPP